MKHLFGTTILSLFLFAVSSCGDLKDKKVSPQEIDTTRFTAGCDLNLDAFKYIIHQDISSQIRCLGANLNLFIKVVKTDRPGYMNRSAFEAYLRNHETDITPEMLKALKQVYELNYLIRGEDREYISKENVDDLINLVIVFNQAMALNFGPIFESEQESTYAFHLVQKGRIKDAANKIMVALLKTFREERGGRIDTLNIINLLEAFSTKDTEEFIAKIKKVLFAKKVLLGGSNEIISHVELQRLIFSFPYLAEIALDAVRYKHILLDQQSIIALLKQDIENLTGIIQNSDLGNRDNEHYVSVETLLDTVKMFVPKESLDIDKFKNLVLYAKKIIMGGNSKDIYGADLKNLLYHAGKLLQTGEVFHEMYGKFRVNMESKLPVAINYNQALAAFPEYPNELKKFIRITQNYRFFKGEFDSGFYTREWRRNADGVFEVALLEYALDLVMRFEDIEDIDPASGRPKAWGTRFPYAGTTFTHAVDQIQLGNIVKKIENELIELELIMPHRAVSMADTIALLGTLFQYQSDENINPATKKGVPVLDVNEATEFATSLISSIGMAKELMKKFRYTCDAGFDNFDRVSPACFRGNFLKFVCEDYRAYFPLLFDSLGTTTCDIPNTEYNKSYLDYTIKAARTCQNYVDDNGKPADEIYYSESDIFSILVAVMHVEATFLRWDKNKNNILDSNEVNEAYSIYSWALDGFLVEKPNYIKLLKKQIYQFMIKYEEIPNEKDPKSIGKFLKFLVSFKKKSPATRKTFASVLYGISEENKKIRIANGTETFQCNWLKDPENIPRTLTSNSTPAPAPESSYAPMLKLAETTGVVDESGEPVFEIPKDKCVSENGQEFCSDEGFEEEVDSELSKPKKKHCVSVLGKTLFCL